MSVMDEFAARLESTDVVKELRKVLREESARMLGEICREYQKTGRSVPDHRLSLLGICANLRLNPWLPLAW